MNKKNITKGVVRSVRLDKILDKLILLIADYEDRSLSNAIALLLTNAVNDYLDKNFEKFIEYVEKHDYNMIPVITLLDNKYTLKDLLKDNNSASVTD